MIFPFKKNQDVHTQTPERETPAAGALLLSRKRITLMIIECAVVLTALSAAVFAWFNSAAWYANNKEVEGSDNSIQSEVATTSLFISAGSTVDNAWNMALEKTWGADGKLYPISTRDCSTWWYVSEFGLVWNNAHTAATAQATDYTSVTTASGITETSGVATYTNSLEQATKVAYLMSEYMLYTNNGTLDVYLDPTAPITVEYGAAQGSRNLLGALRVAIVAGTGNSAVTILYAPVAESGTGNSAGATADTFYAVASANSVSTITMSTIATYQAGGTDPNFTAGTTSLGAATTSGLPVKVYVWLEGTDAQAMLGVSDDDTVGINVNVKYVGVAQS